MATFNYVDENGEVQEIEVNANDIQALDVEGYYDNKNLEDILETLGEANRVYLIENEEQIKKGKAGIYFCDDILDNREDNNVVKRIKDYLNSIVGDLSNLKTNDKTNLVNAINENTSYLKDCAKKKESIIYKNTFSGNENLNDIIEPGIYQIADATNMSNIPNANNKSWSILEVIASNTYVKHIYSSAIDATEFTRTKTEHTNGWNDWRKIATVDDTGWITLPLIPPLVGYGDSVIPKYRKINNIVEVRGAIKGLKTINPNTGLDFSTLPVGFRPKHTMGVVCQGSRLAQWYLTVSSSGVLNIDRYSEDGSTLKTEFNGSEWLPFQIMFSVD